MKAYRQGDVSIMAVKAMPKQARKVSKGELILARGELTGHAHRIVEGQASLHQLGTALYLSVVSRFAKLSHEEHEDIRLPKGEYEIRRQREFDWTKTGRSQGGLRYVED